MALRYHLDLRMLGANIWRLRELRGVDQSLLAREVGVDVRTLRLIEAGRMPRLPTFVRIADFFKVSLDELLQSNCNGEGESLCLLCRRMKSGVGLHARTIQRAEAGYPPRLDTLLLITNRLDTTLDELFRPVSARRLAEAARAKALRRARRSERAHGPAGNASRRPRLVH
jgi:transcriptional regulator with XRE-family HTH domain